MLIHLIWQPLHRHPRRIQLLPAKRLKASDKYFHNNTSSLFDVFIVPRKNEKCNHDLYATIVLDAKEESVTFYGLAMHF